jgi:hypothetical protein
MDKHLTTRQIFDTVRAMDVKLRLRALAAAGIARDLRPFVRLERERAA